MGLCFVGEQTNSHKFLGKCSVCQVKRCVGLYWMQGDYIQPNPGPIKDLATGQTVGQHQGLWNFTIGENARIGGMPEKMFVAKKDAATNAIYVVPRQ